ncbi:histidine phosphatase family protein [Iamia majanohamensis]|uniref:Histidine phosphatase family protein n=1 Tax=Iamia majanohamensis TaxID=467976 RepID=A0AAE9YIA6_9ACTN|nr:histidine phosphatase family protein [Iamia majanohamensis]WCO69032.1 histidine phosphatase family protein [Iamia majanohamensis]
MRPTRLLLVRHGETEWSRVRRHTGRTDLPLTASGEARARSLAGTLPLDDVVAVWSSPLRRARRTAELAGLEVTAVDPDLVEWDYGTAEGRTTAEIREERPGWTVWADGVDEGESLAEVASRVDRVLARAAEVDGAVAIVAHAHLLRVLAARWLGLAPLVGRHLTLDPGGWAVLGWERETPVLERWNPPPPDDDAAPTTPTG